MTLLSNDTSMDLIEAARYLCICAHLHGLLGLTRNDYDVGSIYRDAETTFQSFERWGSYTLEAVGDTQKPRLHLGA
jgi:hypothetical protein